MRAVVMRNWELRVDDLPDPTPGMGQILTRVIACGICGSDLHMVTHGAEARRMQEELGREFEDDLAPDPMRPIVFEPHLDTVMGHEFCCEVLEVGPGCSNLAVGDVVVSYPGAFDARGVHPIGFSNLYSGGYAELMVLNEMMSIKVPTGVPGTMAALTEPLAVGIHAVAKSGIAAGDAAIVLGCGPVGLAVIADLKMRGIGPVIAADFSPMRRSLAEQLGADVVVDPRQTQAIAAWRAADGSKPLVIFEAVGVPGMIDSAIRMAPRGARILVVGACMQADTIHPLAAISKEVSIQFAFGYDALEFSGALTAIAEGKVDLAPWVTGSVGIDAVPQAFADLANPDAHAKILVEPGR